MTHPAYPDARKIASYQRMIGRREPISDEAREAIIEFNRTMKEQRAFAAANRARIDAEWDALEAPPLTIAQHIDHARKLREADRG